MRILSARILLLVAPAIASFAQGPAISSVVGGADFLGGVVGVPRGSIFTITGSQLAPSAQAVPAAPLPTILGGTSVRIWDSPTGGKLLAECPLWYVSPTQINAVLPSSLAAGTYYPSVVAGTLESARTWSVHVTDGRFAPFAQAEPGFGPAVVQEYSGSVAPVLNKLTAPAAPGSTLVLWGTGLGPL